MDAAGVASPPQPPLRSAPQTATPLQLLSPPEAGSLPENSFDGDAALALHLADEERLSALGRPSSEEEARRHERHRLPPRTPRSR